MKITDIETYAVEMKLEEPYATAYENVDSATNVFLCVKTQNNVVGFGCAAPDPYITGETVTRVLDVCEGCIRPYLVGKDPLRIALHMNRLKALIPGKHSALAMVDMALHDILGIQSGLPLYRLLGGFRTEIITSITIGILPLCDTLSRAKEYMSQGFKILKIKGGRDLKADIERIHRVREAVGDDVELRFDANQGFTVEETLQFLKAVKKAHIELIEQPTPRYTLKFLREVTNKVSVPVMADESLMSLKDAFRLASEDIVDMINVKIMKVGGILEAMQINAVAKAANLEVMVGCMDEAALGIAAGLHFALARPNVLYADLDGHLGLLGDPSKGAVILKQGILMPNDNPGLGHHLK
jgi:L-alanine-DL-glutamate epimerase-like enolase superfamily enzyme